MASGLDRFTERMKRVSPSRTAKPPALHGVPDADDGAVN
jgi:hypothetical protein